ncbi:hypothetical protein LTR66_007954, partial [Elasticomyces elasticus]
WVAWGIVQAKVPGMPAFSPSSRHGSVAEGGGSDPLRAEEEAMRADLADKRPEEEADDEEFDYLAYARERAMFFWGDAVDLGVVGAEVLEEGVRGQIKRVEY